MYLKMQMPMHWPVLSPVLSLGHLPVQSPVQSLVHSQ
jgi:hypothetical protein